MYIGVDVGGTKTLVGVFDEHGQIVEQIKIPTPTTYANFLLELRHLRPHLKHQDFKAGGIGTRWMVDREHGRRMAGDSALRWKAVPMQADLEHIFHCPMVLENDAKLAGLSEAMLIKDRYSKVLYVTISTGIGFALVNKGMIDLNLNDGGGQSLILEHNGKHVAWEAFAGGKAIVERYGKKAQDIDDVSTWKQISRDLAKGLVHLIAITEPEAIVIGGAVGNYLDRYEKFVMAELEKYKVPLVELPVLLQAQRPEEAVIYGCYDIAKQRFGHAKTT